MKSALALVVMVFALQGCTVIQATRYSVERYCSLPEEPRKVTRAAVAKALMPNRVEITCYD